MYPVSAAYLAAIRGPHQAWGWAEAWRAGARLTLPGGGTQLPLHADGQNQITVDATTPGARRTLAATLVRVDGLWDVLAPVGTEIKAFTTIRYPSGVTETVPQGVFVIDVERMGYGPAGTLDLTAPDRWVWVQNARFLAPRASNPTLTIRGQIGNLITELLPAGVTLTDTGTSTAMTPVQTWDRDRDKAIQDMATAASVDVLFDRNGNPVIRDAPVINPAAPAWTVDAGPGGAMVSADRTRDRQKTYNMVGVDPQAVDGTVPWERQYVWDNHPASPTYAGGGAGVGVLADVPAASAAGPFGQRPIFYSSPLLSNTAQARTAGATILERVRGLAAQLDLGTLPNLALDDGDTITVRLPPTAAGLVEVHIVDKLTVPLIPSRDPMTVGTRSTRADDPTDS